MHYLQAQRTALSGKLAALLLAALLLAPAALAEAPTETPAPLPQKQVTLVEALPSETPPVATEAPTQEEEAEETAPAPNYGLMSLHNQWVYDYNNGMPSISINDILQTEDGYIWMASHGGLIRFSGDAFVTFSPETHEAFTTYNIMTLFQDSRQRLWIGTSDGGAMVYENHQFRTLDSKALSVTSFGEQSDGTVLMATKEGLYSLDEAGEATLVDDALTLERLMVDSRDGLWLLHSNGDITAPDSFPLPSNLNYHYSGIFEDSRGNILLGTDTGEVLLLEKTGPDHFSLRGLETYGLNQVNDFCEDASGNLWVCADSGLGFLDTTFAYQLADGAKLSSALWSAMTDHEGGIWIASSRNGVLHLMPTVIRDVNFAANIGERVTNAAVTYQGDIYAGTDGGLTLMDGESFQLKENQLTRMVGNTRVRCLTVDSAENLWVATYERLGVIRYSKDGTIQSFNRASGLISDKTRQVLELADGSIAVATNEGVSLIRGDTVEASWGQKEGLTNATVLCLVQDGLGRLVAGTDGGGIFLLEEGIAQPLNVGDLDSRVILRLCYDPQEDGMWIATGSSFYLYTYDDRALQAMPHVFQEVKAVFDIIPTPEGKICLLASEGILYGTRTDLLENTPELVLIRIKGTLPYHITANSWNRIDPEGNLFLCSTKELGLFNVRYLMNNATEAQLIIDSITIDNHQLPPAQTITMPQDAQRITISVSSPHFGFVETFTLEYKLEGFDTETQSLIVGQVNDITYTNLPGGDYTFHIRALNGMGDLGTEVAFQVVKAKQLWEKPEVWVIGGVLLLLLVLLLIRLATRYRTHKILMKQEEYRRITNQAISTISHAIDAKDEYTEGHSQRVAAYAVEIGRRMGLGEEELEKLRYIALLHDIGKIGIHDNILNKPGRLTDDEFHVMKSHTEIGGNILKDFNAVPNIGEGAVAHHEKYDGTGYPQGLKGDEISLTSRIIGVCDTYDAMATNRAYRKALDRDFIINELRKYSGSQFDPQVAEIMIQMINEGFVAQAPADHTKHRKVKPEDINQGEEPPSTPAP